METAYSFYDAHRTEVHIALGVSAVVAGLLLSAYFTCGIVPAALIIGHAIAAVVGGHKVAVGAGVGAAVIAGLGIAALNTSCFGFLRSSTQKDDATKSNGCSAILPFIFK